jgi:hypothetical protein
MAFLKGEDLRQYSLFWTDLANRGNDQYPRDLTSAYSILVNYLSPSQPSQNTLDKDEATPVPTSIGPHRLHNPQVPHRLRHPTKLFLHNPQVPHRLRHPTKLFPVVTACRTIILPVSVVTLTAIMLTSVHPQFLWYNALTRLPKPTNHLDRNI